MTTEIAPDIALIKAESLPWIEKAKAFRITTQEHREYAGALLKEIKGLRTQINKTFDPLITQAYTHHRALVAEKKKHDDPLCEAFELVRQEGAKDAAEQQRVVNAEQERLRKEAYAKAEAEREAERKRLWADGQRKAAQAVAAAPVIVEPVAPPPPAAKVEGVSAKRVWKARIVDVTLIPHEYMLPDTQKLDKLAKALRGEMKVPGVQAYEEIQSVFRG